MAAEEFAGAYEHSVDAKGRVIIPSAFRDQLSQPFTIALNSDRTAIALYPLVQWDKIKARLAQVRSTDIKGMKYVRFVMGNAFTGNIMDLQGRILLPNKLRGMIGITKDIVFVGMGEHIEVWDALAYAKQEDEAQGDILDLLAHMEDRYSE